MSEKGIQCSYHGDDEFGLLRREILSFSAMYLLMLHLFWLMTIKFKILYAKGHCR